MQPVEATTDLSVLSALMKVVLNLVLVALAIAAGWFSQPEVVRYLDARREAERKAFQESVDSAIAAKGGTVAEKDGAGKPKDVSSAAQQLAAAIRGNKAVPAENTPSGDPGGSGVSTKGGQTAPVVDPVDARYPMPKFRDIAEITKEWSSIPSRAFPRKVKILIPVTFEAPEGKIQLPEQSDALAVGMVEGMLVLMRSREDSARSMVPLANTDLKQSLTALYDKFKEFKNQEVMQLREHARSLQNRANGATEAEMAAAGPKPSVGKLGVITAMMESIQAKEIKETSADRIIAWGDVNVEIIDGKSFWTGTVQVTVDTAIFGAVPTELLAAIRNDKVVKWVYSGSREPVQ